MQGQEEKDKHEMAGGKDRKGSKNDKKKKKKQKNCNVQ